ncbi:MlaE family ABC transporter permease [Derxia gummosa]|uniref:MlaE family ABC transporter permease n=1 Tax=Derxia gummosa DSM 723 TaxID=1121388 RepID=A0A8B6X8D2_9BURK|nr:ABC transporter permease [Derxia gummosa]
MLTAARSAASRQLVFLGGLVIALGPLLRGRPLFRAKDFARVLADCSIHALGITSLVNVLVGAILAFVGAVQLVKFGAGIFVADLVAIASSREMAAVITAVVLSGRTGAAFAAELATMQANEEIDALEVLGLPAIDYLVLPRVIALVLMTPLLYVYACVTSLLGGFAVGAGMLRLTPSAYFDRTFEALDFTFFALGFGKSLAFGALIALAACYCGLNASRNAAGVGDATTRAVVSGIVGVIALDAVFAVAANAMGI